jgi:transcriptional regulator with XRE-family HTH domain
VEITRRFGRNLVVHRRQADLSQEELAIRASLHRTEIGHLERGKRLPRIDTLVKLAGALAVPAGDLLKEVTWVPGETRAGHFAAQGSKDRAAADG